MKKERPGKNLPASVQMRLLNKARERQEEHGKTMVDYLLERWLYRLSISPYKDRFVLKGAKVFLLWNDSPHRSTRDLDLLVYDNPDLPAIEKVIKDICLVPSEDDGIHFFTETIQVKRIRETASYEGVRVTLQGKIVSPVLIQIDIGFGDVVTPQAEWQEYPTLLDFPKPRVRCYPRETIIAEKLEAMVLLGEANSRMKDYYDLWILLKTFEFDCALLSQAIQATFMQRKTAIPDDVPVGLTPVFSGNVLKQTQWQAFLRKGNLSSPGLQLSDVVQKAHGFVMPVLSAVAEGQVFSGYWKPGGPWVLDD
ncbi:MAG: nucleotidyl transferase AbiEii/AbiGii toxin family protein [Fimbriimonadia bacterium]|nr:nucleotidyl transferase AbiEii/AbiGii toxin family protein [Fimbriimonadia bacterium]